MPPQGLQSTQRGRPIGLLLGIYRISWHDIRNSGQISGILARYPEFWPDIQIPGIEPNIRIQDIRTNFSIPDTRSDATCYFPPKTGCYKDVMFLNSIRVMQHGIYLSLQLSYKLAIRNQNKFHDINSKSIKNKLFVPAYGMNVQKRTDILKCCKL